MSNSTLTSSPPTPTAATAQIATAVPTAAASLPKGSKCGIWCKCVKKYFESKFGPNLVIWLVFYLVSVGYDFIVKTGNANASTSLLLVPDLTSKVNLSFAIISTLQFLIVVLIGATFSAFGRKKSAGQIFDVEISTVTTIANYYFATVSNYWLLLWLRPARVQLPSIDVAAYLIQGFLGLAVAAISYVILCKAGLIGDISSASGPVIAEQKDGDEKSSSEIDKR